MTGQGVFTYGEWQTVPEPWRTTYRDAVRGSAGLWLDDAPQELQDQATAYQAALADWIRAKVAADGSA